MEADRWQKVEALFHQAAELEPAALATFLSRARQRDAELASEVESLLAADQRAARFIESSLQRVSGDAASAWPSWKSGPIGSRFGSYRLVREIGRGGMSLVYLAVLDDDDFDKRVAIKLIRRGMDDETMCRRFRKEQQILANLEHPNITRLHDGGTTEDGLPYFVMEYVEGMPVDQYCDRHRLPVRGRITLFCQVCQAVNYAHRNLVMHLDLKPSNIIVNEDGQVKLLDFGIAKLLNQDGYASTQEGLSPLTPGFASPEQIRGEPLNTASDVYSLGVVLYFLLSGRRPYRFGNCSAREIERVLRETEPERVSEAVLHHQPNEEPEGFTTPGEVAHSRGCRHPQHLYRLLHGDLDTILHTAMNKEIENRYDSVRALSEDLCRYLEGFPVKACPRGWIYRAKKFTRRHWLGLGSVAAFVCCFAIFSFGLIAFSARTSRERDRAQQLSSLLVSLFEIADSSASRGGAITGKEMLDRGTEKVLNQWRGDQETRAGLLEELAGLYHRIDLYPQAAELFRRGVAIRSNLDRENRDEIASTLNSLGAVLFDEGNLRGAATAFSESLKIRRALFGPKHPKVAISLNNLGLVYHESGQYAKAESVLRGVEAMDARFFGDENPETACSRNSLALLLHDRGEYRAALGLLRKVSRIQEKGSSPEDPYFMETKEYQATTLMALGQLDRAEALFQEVLHHFRERYGEEHRDTARALRNLGIVQREKGDLESAESLLCRSLEIKDRLLGPEHVRVARVQRELGLLYRLSGNNDEAERALRASMAIYRRAYGDSHPQLGFALVGLGLLLERQGRFYEAEFHLQEGLAMLPSLDRRVVEVQGALDRCSAGSNYPKVTGLLIPRDPYPLTPDGKPRIVASGKGRPSGF